MEAATYRFGCSKFAQFLNYELFVTEKLQIVCYRKINPKPKIKKTYKGEETKDLVRFTQIFICHDVICLRTEFYDKIQNHV